MAFERTPKPYALAPSVSPSKDVAPRVKKRGRNSQHLFAASGMNISGCARMVLGCGLKAAGRTLCVSSQVVSTPIYRNLNWPEVGRMMRNKSTEVGFAVAQHKDKTPETLLEVGALGVGMALRVKEHGNVVSSSCEAVIATITVDGLTKTAKSSPENFENLCCLVMS